MLGARRAGGCWASVRARRAGRARQAGRWGTGRHGRRRGGRWSARAPGSRRGRLSERVCWASRCWRRGAGHWGAGGCARDERHCCCDTAGPLPRHGWGHGHDTAAMRAPGRANAHLGMPAGLVGCLCIWLGFLD